MACCIGVSLIRSVYSALDIPDLKFTARSDSTVALWWLKNSGDWSVFVANGVNDINNIVPSQFWHHVSGVQFPCLFSDSLCWKVMCFQIRTPVTSSLEYPGMEESSSISELLDLTNQKIVDEQLKTTHTSLHCGIALELKATVVQQLRPPPY
ncbi:integrase catalytic domain-containing protein [Trichonephila inaurata madagascariensis]|uniref:Integrase catalytic domain-containing protein n=1 Tax=Trichonephila inaurata madagascariensis TaxID=2747483 RepID=A0A8X6XLZ0_9ARAC|nr:integrase catalytic domain-containing protein [Trichonephila inaurata madagascariensis]